MPFPTKSTNPIRKNTQRKVGYSRQYDYDGKYFASVSYRHDASCFAPENRWGNFWSVGAGAYQPREIHGKPALINMLKFKISYGTQGNDNLNVGRRGFTRNYYPLYGPIHIGKQQWDFPTSLYYRGNRDITWETSHSFKYWI